MTTTTKTTARSERWDTRWARSVQRSELGLGAKRTAALLATFMNAKGECFPSQATLAHHAGTKPRAIRYNLHALVDAGWLTIRRRGDGQTAVYRAAFPKTKTETAPTSRPKSCPTCGAKLERVEAYAPTGTPATLRCDGVIANDWESHIFKTDGSPYVFPDQPNGPR